MTDTGERAVLGRVAAWCAVVLAVVVLCAGKLALREDTADSHKTEPPWQMTAQLDVMGDLLVYGKDMAMGGGAAPGQWLAEARKLGAKYPSSVSVAIRTAAFAAQAGEQSDATEALRVASLTDETLAPVARALEPDASTDEQLAGLDAATKIEPLWARHALRLAIPECDTLREDAVISAEAPSRLGRIVVLFVLVGAAGCLSIPAFFLALIAKPLARVIRPGAVGRDDPRPYVPGEGRGEGAASALGAQPAAPLQEGGEYWVEGEQTSLPEVTEVLGEGLAPLGWTILDAAAAIALFFLGQFLVGGVAFVLGATSLASTALSFVIGGALAAWFLTWRAGRGFWAAAGYRAYPTWKAVPLAMWALLALPVPMYLVGAVYYHFVGEAPVSANPALDMIVGADSPLAKLTMFLLVAVAAPFVEETLFRGALFEALRRRFCPAIVVAVTALAFAGAHLDPMALPQYILIGVSLGIVRQVSGSLKPAIILHALFNASSYLLVTVLRS
jgi:membrane protease YdiL (CAAX protease family)